MNQVTRNFVQVQFADGGKLLMLEVKRGNWVALGDADSLLNGQTPVYAPDGSLLRIEPRLEAVACYWFNALYESAGDAVEAVRGMIEACPAVSPEDCGLALELNAMSERGFVGFELGVLYLMDRAMKGQNPGYYLNDVCTSVTEAGAIIENMAIRHKGQTRVRQSVTAEACSLWLAKVLGGVVHPDASRHLDCRWTLTLAA